MLRMYFHERIKTMLHPSYTSRHNLEILFVPIISLQSQPISDPVFTSSHCIHPIFYPHLLQSVQNPTLSLSKSKQKRSGQPTLGRTTLIFSDSFSRLLCHNNAKTWHVKNCILFTSSDKRILANNCSTKVGPFILCRLKWPLLGKERKLQYMAFSFLLIVCFNSIFSAEKYCFPQF